MKALIFLLVGLNAYAGTQSLEQAVANDIQALLDDTVNEGEQQAHVNYPSPKNPAVRCQLREHRDSPSKKWAFCTVDFIVSDSESSEGRSCQLSYVFEPNAQELTLNDGNEEQFVACTESLSEGL